MPPRPALDIQVVKARVHLWDAASRCKCVWHHRVSTSSCAADDKRPSAFFQMNQKCQNRQHTPREVIRNALKVGPCASAKRKVALPALSRVFIFSHFSVWLVFDFFFFTLACILETWGISLDKHLHPKTSD